MDPILVNTIDIAAAEAEKVFWAMWTGTDAWS